MTIFAGSVSILKQCFSNFNVHTKKPVDLDKNEDSDLVDLGWGLRLCISNKLSVDIYVASSWTTLD